MPESLRRPWSVSSDDNDFEDDLFTPTRRSAFFFDDSLAYPRDGMHVMTAKPRGGLHLA
jgi:hypothetical protein